MSVLKYINPDKMWRTFNEKEGKGMIFFIGISIIIIDQIIKAIITIHIPYGTFIGKWFRITNVANTGMAYGMRKK